MLARRIHEARGFVVGGFPRRATPSLGKQMNHLLVVVIAFLKKVIKKLLAFCYWCSGKLHTDRNSNDKKYLVFTEYPM